MRELLNYRYWVLLLISGITMVLLFADKEDGDVLDWLFFHLTNKMVAVLMIILLMKLVNYWNPKGKIDLLARLQRKCEDLLS